MSAPFRLFAARSVTFVAVSVAARAACPSEVSPLGIQMTVASVALLSSFGTFSALETSRHPPFVFPRLEAMFL